MLMRRSVCLAALLLSATPLAASAQSTLTLGMVIGTTGAFAGGEAPLVNGTKMAVAELTPKAALAVNRSIW